MTRLCNARALSVILLAAVLTACAGSRAGTTGTNTIRVESDPPDAEVWVMGKSWGRAPVEVPLKEVFPVVYSPYKYELHGKVRLVREGCEPLTLRAGSLRAGESLKGRLECAEPLPPIAPVAAEPEAPATAPEPPRAAPAAEPPEARERLLRLQRLRDEGLISEEEYEQLRRRVLDAL
jgi:hypothetical protein